MKKYLKVFIVIGILIFVMILFLCLFFFTNIFKSTLIPMNVKNISIQYIPTYPISYEEQKNEKEQNIYELITISLKKNDVKLVKSSLKKIKKSIAKKKSDDAIARILIDQDTTLLVGEKQGVIIRDKKETPITYSNQFSDLILSYIEKNNQKIFEKISFEKASIYSDGAHISISNDDNINLLKDYLKYYPINRLEDYNQYDGGSKMQLVLDNQNTIYLYSDHSAYCVLKDKDPFYAAFPIELQEIIQKIIDLSTEK